MVTRSPGPGIGRPWLTWGTATATPGSRVRDRHGQPIFEGSPVLLSLPRHAAAAVVVELLDEGRVRIRYVGDDTEEIRDADQLAVTGPYPDDQRRWPDLDEARRRGPWPPRPLD